MPAIETDYDGHRFRSRLEARWAVFFDALDIPYQYEVEGYEWEGIGRYLPDFYLPTIGSRTEKPGGVFVEVKPDWYRVTDYDRCRYEQLVRETKKPLILIRGMPRGTDQYQSEYCVWEECRPTPGLEDGDTYAGWDEPMLFIRCEACGSMRFEFSESNYLVCGLCEAPAHDEHVVLLIAANKARTARFFVPQPAPVW